MSVFLSKEDNLDGEMAELEEANHEHKYVRPPSPKAPSKTEQRIRQFEAELEGPKLDLNKLRAAAFSGESLCAMGEHSMTLG